MNADTLSLSAVLQFLICVGIVWVGKTNISNSKALVRLETILTGASGDNGLVSEVGRLRQKQHGLVNDVHGLKGEHSLLSQRLDQLTEERA
jgi:hypothetical protein